MSKRRDNKSVPNMKRALCVDGLIMAETMVYQPKKKLKESQGEFLPKCDHLFLKNVIYCKG